MALFDRRTSPGNDAPALRYGVLLVDDEALNLSALSGLLGDTYRVHTASNASGALALLADPAVAAGIQVVLSDQRMPGMSGVELLSRIRVLRPDIKSLLLTGYNDMAAVVAAVNEAGIYRYLQKPVDIPELRLTLVRATEAWQLEQDNRELVVALSRSYEKLAMLDAAKTSFLRYLAHEVNTPLNWLAAASVIDRQVLSEETARMLQYVDLGRERLCGLVGAVVRYFEAAGLELRTKAERVDVAALVAARAAVQQGARGGFTLRCESSPALLIETDPELLTEALDHLIENAVTHAVRDGGAPEIVVQVRPAGEGAVIEVHNSGRVPQQATLDRLFQPFFFCGSLHGEQGYGLSLATARVLALTLGGALDAVGETVTDGGLCLRLALPARIPAIEAGFEMAMLRPARLDRP